MGEMRVQRVIEQGGRQQEVEGSVEGYWVQ